MSITRGLWVNTLYFSAFGLLFIHALQSLKDKRIFLPSLGHVSFEFLQKASSI